MHEYNSQLQCLFALPLILTFPTAGSIGECDDVSLFNYGMLLQLGQNALQRNIGEQHDQCNE